MLRKTLVFAVPAAMLAAMSVASWCQDKAATSQPAAAGVKTYNFEGNDALADWRIVGDATVDTTKSRQGKGASLKLAPGSKATVKLAKTDGGGKVDMWIFDDCSLPADPKAAHAGPRWGIVQSDGQALAIGILYASYLAGDDGYTATASNGSAWFDKLFWLSVDRKPAGWHEWTFDFNADKGILNILRDGKPIPADDAHWHPDGSGIKGFNAVTLWGDGADKGQTIWVADVTYTPAGASASAATKPAETKPAAK